MTVEKEKQTGWKQKIVHEMTEYWINFVYLAVVFFTFTSYRRLILDEYHVSYLHYGFAVIQAAVLAKVILIGEAAGAGRKYEDRPLIVPTLHKTIVFAIWVVVFKVLEHVIGGLVRGKGLAGGFHDLISEGWYEILANGLVVISAFVPFFAIKELGRVLGREKLRALFFRRRASNGTGLPHELRNGTDKLEEGQMNKIRRSNKWIAALIIGAMGAALPGTLLARDRGFNQPGAAGNVGRDPGVNQPGAAGNVGGVGPGVDPGVNQPGAAGNVGRDPGLNQPGAAGNVGGAGPGVDPGLNQPGAAGNVGRDPGLNQPGAAGNRRR